MMDASLWWWALPLVALPILWHRRKREQTRSAPLASARFLPAAEPKQLRAWRWDDPLLLALRCLLLVTLVALLADLALAWRGDAVLVVPGASAAAVAATHAQRIELPDRDAAGWLHAHEREFKPDARLTVVGDAAMPAVLPTFRHPVSLQTNPAATAQAEHHVAIVGAHADAWRRLFAAAAGTWRVVVDARPGPRTELIVWDSADAPPAGLHAPLWWVADARAFPELAQAASVDGVRVAASAHGRLWTAAGWPPADAARARALFGAWQRLHLGVQPYTAPPQALAADPHAPAAAAAGDLRDWLAIALVALFVLERMLTHVRRR